MRLSGLLRKVCREKKEPKTLCHLVESHGREEATVKSGIVIQCSSGFTNISMG